MKILIADDSQTFRHLLHTVLTKMGFDVADYSEGLTACAALKQKEAPTMAILDWEMPGMDGLQVCREIRKQEALPYTYLMLLTGKNERQDVLEGFRAGADDFLFKPLDVDELTVRLQTARRILTWQEQLIKAQEQLRMQALRDALTGLWNRRAIYDLLDKELHRGLREGKPVGVVVMDLDHFKRVNDTFGHEAGDAVLLEVSNRMTAAIRPYDTIGRYGGEEFLLVLTGCDQANMLSLCERLRAQVAASPVECDGKLVPVTISIGAVLVQPAEKVESRLVVRAADQAMYRAKQGGRNRVELGVL